MGKHYVSLVTGRSLMAWGKAKIDPADKAFSWWVRSRDGWECQRCHAQHPPPTRALHCSHFHGRGKESTRFNPDNCTSLCFACHQYLTSHPQKHDEWQKKRLGEKKYNILLVHANTPGKRDRKLALIVWREKLKQDYPEHYRMYTRK